MKRFSVFVVVFSAVVCTLVAEEAKEVKEPAQLTQLREQQRRAINQAVIPLKQKYLEQLKGLLSELTKAGKLDEAVLVQTERKTAEEELEAGKEALALKTSKARGSKTPAELRAYLEGTTWSWNPDRHPITFEKGGVLEAGWTRGTGKWDVTKDLNVKITYWGTDSDLIKFSDNFTKLACDSKGGYRSGELLKK
jgi:hypothetical protein